jgi:hypothetical protein
MAMGSTPPIRCEIRAELLPATEKGLQVLANTAAVRAELRRAGGLNPVARLIDSERCLEVTYEVEASDAEEVAQLLKRSSGIQLPHSGETPSPGESTT